MLELNRRVAVALVVLTAGWAVPGVAQPRPGVTTRASVATGGSQGNAHSRTATVSWTGRHVAFGSMATNLVANDTNDVDDVFVHDRATGVTTRVSVATGGTQGNAQSVQPVISADGRYVAFSADASNLVAGDTNSMTDVFVHDRDTGVTTRVSVATDTTQGNNRSFQPAISADGRFVAFASSASSLVAGDTNAKDDIFVHDRQTGVTTRVSVASDAGQGTDHSYDPAISADGLTVAFRSYASDLVANDTNGEDDIFVHDRQTGVTTRVSVATGGVEGNGSSDKPAISADGRYVAFGSMSSNLAAGDDNGTGDVFVHDRTTGITARVSVATGGTQGNGGSDKAAISADGRFVAFASYATNLVAGGTNGQYHAFLHDRDTGITMLANVATDRTQGDGPVGSPALGADGRIVAFDSYATNLVPGDTNVRFDVFVIEFGSGVVFDFHGDLKSDILWHHATRGEVWLWPMDGPAKVTESHVQTLGEPGWEIRGGGDLTGDGQADILWRNALTGMLYLWTMDGSTVEAETYVGTVELAYDVIGMGDYNGDGMSDLLWRNPTNGEFWIWLMNGAVPLSQVYVDTIDPAYVVQGSGDLNGDGKADLVWRHATGGDVWVWLMNGAVAQSVAYVETVAELDYRIVGIADHTGDGQADLLWHHATRGEVWVWPMDGTTLLGQSYVDAVPETDYRVVGHGDYDADGKADLLWHHATRGEVWVWLMDGVVKLSENYVGAVPEVEYQIVRSR